MTTHAPPRPASTAPLLAVSTGAAVFALLLLAVRLRWAPLESVDHTVAARMNDLVAGRSVVVAILRRITWFGSDGVLWTVTVASALILALRRRYRLALYLLVTGGGALVLDPVLKSLVGRLRPVVAHPVAHGTGSSFPSGHSLGSIVCYGALLLVFTPATRGRTRTALRTLAIVLVALVGVSRILLGVHYVSDVLGAWAIGIAWLGVTTLAFELVRHETGRRTTAPVAEGLEPEAEADLAPVAAEAAIDDRVHAHPWRVAAGVLTAWVLILGMVTGFGELVTRHGGGNVLGDTTVPRWLAAHRTPTLTAWSAVFSTLGATQAILILSLTTCAVFLAITRRWREVVFVATLMVGELAMFLVAAAVVDRARPPVPHLDQHLPTSAYPSGHEAATCCAYIGLAILVIGHARGWWRWLFLVPAIAMPILVAASRMYRGEHHPTDIAGSLLFAALWLPAATMLMRPDAREDRP